MHTEWGRGGGLLGPGPGPGCTLHALPPLPKMRLPLPAALLAAATSAGGASAFAPPGPAAAFLLRPAISVPPAATTSLGAIRCEGKTYQLEEREDSEICTTEVHLNPDRSVLVGDTDGPYFEASAGEWNVAPGTNDFTMRIQKRFRTGQSSTDMGEFAFDVYRVYRGDMALVGDSVAITGVMTDDHDSDKEVGFFNMIDGTDEKDGYEGRARSLRST